MKLAFTICDMTHAMHGGEVERKTYIVEVDDSTLPKPILKHMQAKRSEKPELGQWCYESMSISIVEL